jgi:prolyl oligopeptidase
MAEYGDPDTTDWKEWLHKFSPFHLIDESVEYPPILFTTSTRDDRVHPAHARKMVARLADTEAAAAAAAGDKKNRKVGNVYYYENMEGGHGGAADSKQSAFMMALEYDFLWNKLAENVVEKK